jgi:hypothetical protein
LVAVPQLARLELQGESVLSRVWRPCNEQSNLEPLQLLPPSVPFIEAVVSRTTTTLVGLGAEPVLAAVAIAASVRDLAPTIAAKVIGTVTICFTWMALATAGASHGIPWFFRV